MIETPRLKNVIFIQTILSFVLSRNTIVPGHKFFQAKYLEKLIEKKHSQDYNETRKIAYIHKTSIVYPFVNFKEEKDKYILTIMNYVELLHMLNILDLCHYKLLLYRLVPY